MAGITLFRNDADELLGQRRTLMGLFNDHIKPRRTGNFWKIKELMNSFKFSLGSVEEFFEIDELLGRGETYDAVNNDYSFFHLLCKLENLAPGYRGIEFEGYLMMRIRGSNTGLLLKLGEQEIDFVSDQTLKSMTIIHVLQKLKEFNPPEQLRAPDNDEPVRIGNEDQECRSQKQLDFTSPSPTESLSG